MNNSFIPYKKKYTFSERCERAKIMKEKYPQKLPIVLMPEKNITIKSAQFLVEKDITFSQFISVIRKNNAVELKSHEAIYCIVGKLLPPSSALLSDIFSTHAEPDGILYVHIKKESTFG
jgi:GABA(A) receptor-associated protein